MKNLILLGALALLTSCSNHLANSAPSSPLTYEVGRTAKSNQPRLIQRSGKMGLSSRSLKKSSERSISLISQYQGRISNASLTEENYQATIKVPSTSLSPLMSSLRSLGKVTHETISMEDVTGKHSDLAAALQNKRALRDRLRKLLSTATKVKDILKIEEQLARVQTELDQMEGRMKLMNNRVAHSTLNLSIERQSIPGPLGIVKKSSGWFLGKLINLN